MTSVSRIANEDYFVANTNIKIEKGTNIICSIYSIHNDPDIYPEPENYDPDRFTLEEVKKRHPFSFVPFDVGQRSCVAPRYDNMILKIALVKILTNFEFKLENVTEKLALYPNEELVNNFHKISTL